MSHLPEPTRATILALVCEAIEELNATLPTPIDLSQGEDARLYGKDGVLDSLELVNLVLLVEELVDDGFGASITLTSDRALSQFRSPFRTLGTLVDTVQTLIRQTIAVAA